MKHLIIVVYVPSQIITFPSTATMFTAGLGTGEDARLILDRLAPKADYLTLFDNPWECPPASVVRKGIDWMKKYYDELEKADPVMIDTRKVVFIGESGAGKTRCDYGCNRHSITLDCYIVGRNVLHQRHLSRGSRQTQVTMSRYLFLN